MPIRNLDEFEIQVILENNFKDFSINIWIWCWNGHYCCQLTLVREILAAERGTLKKILQGRKLIWNWWTAVGFHFFFEFWKEEWSWISISLESWRLVSLVLFKTAYSCNDGRELELVIWCFPWRHGHWQTWPTKYQQPRNCFHAVE